MIVLKLGNFKSTFSDDPSTTTYHGAADGEQLELDCLVGEERTSDVITWYKDGRVVLEDFSHELTNDGAVLTVRDLRPADRGRYECEITDRTTAELIRRRTFVVTEGGLICSFVHIAFNTCLQALFCPRRLLFVTN